MSSNNFIKNIIKQDNLEKVVVRFPPEPNGFLHIGHAKSIFLNFGLANEFGGYCNLRFDDTNPSNENMNFVESIKSDILWLGCHWREPIRFASDYFEKMFEYALSFIENDLAYVCDLSTAELKEYRGDFQNPGIDSPYRNRSVAENLEMFYAMRDGGFSDGSKTLRLKISMQHHSLIMRDPVIYRVKHTHHIRTGDKWCIYPMYDYAHCICDALEKITHSCCTLEFEEHRILYDWIINHLYNVQLISHKPQQIEFSRLVLENTVTSKRRLNALVQAKLVSGWNDPRLSTISGMRRRGYPSVALKNFIDNCGVAKSSAVIDAKMLQHEVRKYLQHNVPKLLAVLNPVEVVFTNFDSNKVRSKQVSFHTDVDKYGMREIALTDRIYIENTDFLIEPSPKWHRLTHKGEVRLRYSYIIKCDNYEEVDGKLIRLYCSIDYDTFGIKPADRKVKGVIHWVNTNNCIKVHINVYHALLNSNDNSKVDIGTLFNQGSLEELSAYVEPALLDLAEKEAKFQFERVGYFVADQYNFSKDNLVFNKIIDLKDYFSR